MPDKAKPLLQRIHTEFPNLSWSEFRYIDNGWDHEVIILDSRLVFRFPDDREYLDLLPLEIEVLQDLSSRVRAAIPTYTYIAADKSFAGYKIVPGDNLSTTAYHELSEGTRQQVVGQLAEFLTGLHAIDITTDPYARVQPSYLPADLADTKRDSAKFLVPVLTAAEMAYVQEVLQTMDAVLAQATPVVFTHGDMYSRHLLWDAEVSRLGVIDFSDMMLGDPAIDFAELYEYGEDFVQAVYAAYGGPKDAGFLKRAWIYQCWMGIYMLTDHFNYGKTSFAEARETFDRTIGHGLEIYK